MRTVVYGWTLEMIQEFVPAVAFLTAHLNNSKKRWEKLIIWVTFQWTDKLNLGLLEVILLEKGIVLCKVFGSLMM